MQEHIAEGLNTKQKEAVLHFDSPLLIIAGAGSGKTKVITHKISHLITQRGLSPDQILGVTFTNKAAQEMKARIESLTGISHHRFNISTFHSLGLKILRESGKWLGFDPEWLVIDDSEQKRVLERIIRENYSYLTRDQRDNIRRRINLAKMNMGYPNNPDQLARMGFSGDEIDIYSQYFSYQREKKIWDYEDLISFPVRLLETNESARRKYAARFKYILIDEFQDTNPNQYDLIKLISARRDNITVVGDDDQAIYSWRGANVRFLMTFEEDFPGTRVVKLERNYRSTQSILQIANDLINKNLYRRSKSMWTKHPPGEPVHILRSISKEDEAAAAADYIEEMARRQSDCFPLAILYRVNSQSLAFESEFQKRGIKYKIVKGLRFFERKEIKDCFALLKLTFNLDDDHSFLRIIDFLPMGIGPKSLAALTQVSRRMNQSYFRVLKDQAPDKYQAKPLFNKIFELNQQQDRLGISQVLTRLLQESRYLDILGAKKEESRLLNIDELINFVKEWESENPSDRLPQLIDQITINESKEEEGENQPVLLLTMHNAKGLEFPTVFVAGSNLTFMPFFLRKERNEIEEERRLFYVAVTRAIRKLIISIGGKTQSSFLAGLSHHRYENIYSIDQILPSRAHSPGRNSRFSGSIPKARFMLHPKFGKGRILNTLDKHKHLVDFEEKGEKIIDTSIVEVTFL